MADKRKQFREVFGKNGFFTTMPEIEELPVDTSIQVNPHESENKENRKIETTNSTTTKFTFYFSLKQLDDLDDARIKLKREHGIKTDKSAIVRLALDNLLDDFNKMGAASLLVNKCANKSIEKQQHT